MCCLLGALAALASPATALPGPVTQITRSDEVELLIRVGDPSPYVDSTGVAWTYSRLSQLRSTPDGGWTARANIMRESPLRTGLILVGQDGDALSGPVIGQLMPNLEQSDAPVVGPSSRALGQTAWIDLDLAGSALFLDDQLLIDRFDPVAGAPGWTWSAVNDVRLTSSGDIFVSGRAFEPTIGNPQQAFANVATGELLINGFDFVPGLNQRLDEIVDWSTSADGTHWILEAEIRNSLEHVLILNGQAYEPAPGFVVRWGAPVPPSVEAVLGDAAWRFFFSTHVNSRGDVLLDALVNVGPGTQRVFLLNGEVFYAGPDSRYVIGLTEEGAVVQAEEQRTFTMDSLLLDVSGGASVDVDRDGTPDPLFRCRAAEEFEGPLGTGPVHFLGILDPPTGPNQDALFRARSATIGSIVCTGAPNSLDRSGAIVAVGSSVASESDLTLEVFDLPPNARGYALFSRSLGTPVTPPGSEGELCLSG
ncbi:MAG: hypothetical protein AAGG01_22570, partial [Planctomycetota bacterium]